MTEITQADREAAADWLQSMDDGGHTYNAIRRGEEDNMDLVQAFAKHRQAAIAQQIEKDAGIAERWDENSPHSSRAAAIRAQKP